MIYRLEYMYDIVPEVYYFKTNLSTEQIDIIINKWNLYAFDIDTNFAYGATEMILILNTYDEINICKIEEETEVTYIELFDNEDHMFDMNYDITYKDMIRVMMINKFINEFYIS